MEIKQSSSYPVRASERSVQASHQSDRRDDAHEADLSNRKVVTSLKSARSAANSSGQAQETRFFALESRRDDTPVDSKKQVHAMRERVRQTYAEQENHAARDAIREQQAQNVQNARAERRAQHDKAQQAINLIA